MHSSATFSTPAFSTLAFFDRARVFSSRVFSRPFFVYLLFWLPIRATDKLANISVRNYFGFC